MPQTRTKKLIRPALCALLLAPFSMWSVAQTLALAEPSALNDASTAISYNVPHLVFEKNLQPISYSENDSRRALNALKHDALIQHAALRSEIAFVQDLESSTVLYQKNSDAVRPIASITKLMTALVVAESGLPMDEMLEIIDEDVDRVKHSSSRLRVGSKLNRADMMHLALMSSENRAAHALGRSYPGGLPAFVRAMNDKARALGMRNTRFVEPTGLSSDNVASPRDLVKLLTATSQHDRIQQYTTNDQYSVQPVRGRQLVFNNTNRLVKNANWDIQVSKTGFINEAGECLVMLTKIEDREVAIVLLNSTGRYSRIGDAVRIRNLVEKSNGLAML
ncbi:D-alanyl-D-alanine endopeptidase [Alcaligenes aquatilis]|uniref:D-alanyl-D-alanine endopeptidase n=1 Tax=Alcaligenes aquatilis TaxID=323284 RepID=A0ABY4NNC0_9BURK|nr:D-alanyl-D-alanine endopeptidase [Alcaligenes aquatilis]UQN37712.1 D-alanyl-D-alanine endopeptidase [Alcaligenes aquatilis]